MKIKLHAFSEVRKEKNVTKTKSEILKELSRYKTEADKLKADHWASDKWKEYFEHLEPEWREYCSDHRKEIALIMFDYMYNEGLSREEAFEKAVRAGVYPTLAGNLSYDVRTVLHNMDSTLESSYNEMIQILKHLDLTVEEVKKSINYTGWRP